MDNSNTNKAIKGMSSQSFVTLALGVIEIGSFSIMSRLLSQEDFGYYAAITAITTIFSSFSDTGMGAAIIQRKAITERFVNNAFTFSFLVGIFLSLLLVCMARPLADGVSDVSMTVPLMIMSFPLFCHCVSSVQFSIMKRRLQFMKVGFILMISTLIASIIAIILAYYGLGYYAIISRAVLSSFLGLLFSHIAAHTKFSFALDKKTFGEIFGFSGWLTASVFLRNLASQMDKLLMTNLLSVTALGAYNRPKEFVNHITSKLGGIFDTALFPILSQLQDDKARTRSAYMKSMYILNLFAVVASMGMVFNAELVIRVFFGVKWLSILPTLQILSLYMIFHYDGRLADCFLRSLGLTKQQFKFRFIQVIIYTIGILICYRWGINGIAISVVLCDAIMVILKHLYIASKIDLQFSDGITVLVKSWKIGVINLPVLLVVYYLMSGSITGCIVSVLIYLLLIIVEFVALPNIIGKQYKEEFYPQIKATIFKKINKRKI